MTLRTSPRTYFRIVSGAVLPVPGPQWHELRESGQLDFKETTALDTPLEHAKDMAAFANWLGGVILIGAKEDGGVVTYPGISVGHAARLKEAYEKAAKDHCDPSPIIDAIPVEFLGKTLLAVNVDPHVGGLIAAEGGCKKPNQSATATEGAWRFPVRVASHTRYLRPTELPMYINPAIRRVFLLLNSIPEDKRKYGKVYSKETQDPKVATRRYVELSAATPLKERPVVYSACSLEKNAAVFCYRTSDTTAGQFSVNVPLTDIEDVWEVADGKWAIRVRGILQDRSDKKGLDYLPTYG